MPSMPAIDTTDQDPFLTIPEAAQRLGRAPKTVRRMIAKGQLSGVELSERTLVRAAEVDALIEGRDA